MTHGKHVTAQECAEMRRLNECGYWAWHIAEKMEVSKSAVDYHIHGHCTHEHE